MYCQTTTGRSHYLHYYRAGEASTGNLHLAVNSVECSGPASSILSLVIAEMPTWGPGTLPGSTLQQANR